MRLLIEFIVSAALSTFGFATLATAAACTLPYNITNGQTADASQVMANFNALLNCVNANGPAGQPNAVQYNAGSGSFGGAGPLGNGQLLIGSNGGPPQAATLNAGPGVTITNGPASITIGAGTGSVSTYSWLRLVLVNNGGGNAFAWAETSIKDINGVAQTVSLARSSQVWSGTFNGVSTTPDRAFDGNTATIWGSSDTTINFFDIQFTSAFAPGYLTITARPDSLYTDSPVGILVYGSNDGVTFFSISSVNFSRWTSAGQSQTVALH